MRRFGSTVWEHQPQAFVFPMRRGSVELAAAGPDCIVALRVDPVVASVLLRRPLGELWDAPTSLRDLIGGEADGLVEAIGCAVPQARFAIIERWLQMRLSDWTRSEDALSAIHARLFWKGDGTPLENVARDLGSTMRSLRRWTANTAGLSPKEIEREGRILRSCALLREQPQLTIASVAHEVRFYDQAAFTHAFSQQVGMSPSIFRSLPVVHYETERH